MSGPAIRRILVALDASPTSLAAARAAAELAALWNAELRGLFVEDAEMLRLSRSPLAREQGFVTASPRGLASGHLESQFRAHAKRARAALERLAEEAGVSSTFEVSRGSVTAEIVAAAADADLVSLGRIGWSVRRKRRLGQTVRALIAVRGRVLLMERPVVLKPPIVVLHDGSAAGREALSLAARLVALRSGPVSVLLLGSDERLRREARNQLGGLGTDVWIERLEAREPSSVARAVCYRMGGVVIVPVSPSQLREEHLEALVDAVACPVLVVSAGEAEATS